MDDFTESRGAIFDWDLFRRDVRRDVRNCALCLFLFYAVMLIASVIVMAASMLANAAGAIESFLESGGQDMTDALDEVIAPMSIVGIVAGSCVFFILRRRRFITDLAAPMAEPLTPRIFMILVVVTQAIQFVYAMIVSLIDELLPEGLSMIDSYGDAMEGLFTPLGVLYVVLIGPIFEELIFRGAVLGTLRRFGDNFAILFSAILFGFYHGIILQIPFGFAMGLLFGYVAVRWSLRISIVLHIIVNGLSVLFSDVGNEALTTAGGVFMIACTAMAVVCAIKWRATLKARINACAAYYPKTYANGFSSVAFWIFIVVMAGFGLIQMNPDLALSL